MIVGANGGLFDRVRVMFNGQDIFIAPAYVERSDLNATAKSIFANGFSADGTPTGIIRGNLEVSGLIVLQMVTTLTPTLFDQFDYDSTNVQIIFIPANSSNNYTANNPNVYAGSNWQLVCSNVAFDSDSMSNSEGVPALQSFSFKCRSRYVLGQAA